MMIGIVSRLTDQKGFDLIAYVMDELCQDAIQLVVLGTGDERYENMFRHFDWKYHGKVSAQIYYDETMSHRIYAAADAFPDAVLIRTMRTQPAYESSLWNASNCQRDRRT